MRVQCGNGIFGSLVGVRIFFSVTSVAGDVLVRMFFRMLLGGFDGYVTEVVLLL